jgi:hypothetical protein
VILQHQDVVPVTRPVERAVRRRAVRNPALAPTGQKAAAPQTNGSTLKAREIFVACHDRYRSLTEWMEEGRGRVRAVSLESPAMGYQWRPERSRACEYVADFERIGRQALRRPEWKGRLKLFEIYFLHSMEYREAMKLVGVAEGTFDYWMAEVKRACGKEFSRCGLFPPSRYFLST